MIIFGICRIFGSWERSQYMYMYELQIYYTYMYTCMCWLYPTLHTLPYLHYLSYTTLPTLPYPGVQPGYTVQVTSFKGSALYIVVSSIAFSYSLLANNPHPLKILSG